jgi:predicted fused transcriptional regulator/phosphomethylpyrimidine kinase
MRSRTDVDIIKDFGYAGKHPTIYIRAPHEVELILSILYVKNISL